MRHPAFAVALLATAVLAACQSPQSQLAREESSPEPLADRDQAPLAVVAPPPPSPPPAPPVSHAPAEAAKSTAQAQHYEAESRSLDAIAVGAGHANRSDDSLRLRRMAAVPAPSVAPAPITVTGSRIAPGQPPYTQPANTENYEAREDNPVHRVAETPVSTFSIDVDTGSYSNVRRMIRDGIRPPADAVRAEEFINYFDYGHAGPSSLDTPFKATVELAPAPWNPKRQLMMVGIKGYDVPKAQLPPANLVFLLDTSGSMESPDKLPLLKQAFSQLTEQLRPQDRVSIVVYAGSAGLVLPPTPGDRKAEILAALDRLEAGGSTNGGDGIRLAYAMAKQAFQPKGINRVILATDGDFNVGTVDGGSLETMVADQRKAGIALTTLGFGTGNYNDHLAERLADAGDGNHAYIDTLQEARKVLVEEMSATLLTIAQDVKIQVEFNPAQVAEYRLIGYENRLLAREDFANDKVDAGDIGAGHEVTALYEVVLVGSGAERLPALRYGNAAAATANTGKGSELAHLRLRYKTPGESTSKLIETPVTRAQMTTTPSDALRFASTVAAYADALRGGKYLDGWDWSRIAANAGSGTGADPWKLRAEFAELVGRARTIVEASPDAGVAGGDVAVAD